MSTNFRSDQISFYILTVRHLEPAMFKGTNVNRYD